MCIWKGVAFSVVTSEYQKGGTGLPQGLELAMSDMLTWGL